MSIGGSTTNRSINLELGRSATATSSLNESALRTLAGVASGAISLSNFYGKSNFSPTNVVRTSGTGATETVPSGAVSVRIRAYGGGGGGGTNINYSGGGGGGGFVEATYSCSGGQTLTYTVGGQVAAGNGGAASTVTSGTLSITSISAGGGGAGSGSNFAPGIGGAGGAASGGSTNTDGEAGGDDYSLGGGVGGACLGTGGGAADSIPGGGGSSFSPGQRGQIEFYYT
jgi:hypothetical protein